MTGPGNAVVEALPGIVGGLLSGTVAGLLAARAEVGYQQRAVAVTEIRKLALDASVIFRRQAIEVGYAMSEERAQRFYEEGFYEIVSAIDTLARYYGVHVVWLGAPTREAVEKIVSELTAHNIEMFETVNKGQDARREAGRAAMRWHDNDLLKLVADVQTRPRWPGARILGKLTRSSDAWS